MTVQKHTSAAYDIRAIRTALGLTTDAFGVVLDTSSKTVERWEKSGIPDAAPVHILEDLHRLKALADLGGMVYGERFREFLRTPMQALGGKAPWRLLVAGEVESVYALLVAAYEGDGL